MGADKRKRARRRESLGMKRKDNKIKNRGTMGVCERMWGSKGSASWKVTVSSRRGVLYPIRVTLSCASLFRPSISAYVTVTLLFSSPSYRFPAFPTIWPFSSVRPPTHLPSPFFFFSSHGNSKFEGKGWIPPNQVLTPPLLRRPGYPARSLLLLLSPLHFSVTLSSFSPLGHLYLDLRTNNNAFLGTVGRP
jgi:hypothetical protein